MPDTSWVFPPASSADEHGIVGVGADLEPETVLAAYTQGLFPMPLEADGPIAWWSPDPRAIIPVGEIHVSRSLHRSMRRFQFTIDTDFGEVIRACANPSRPHGWIDAQIIRAYERLHDLGWAHSIETRNEAGELVGGVYGLATVAFLPGNRCFIAKPTHRKPHLPHCRPC